jgi:hypothetical protein
MESAALEFAEMLKENGNKCCHILRTFFRCALPGDE